MKQALPHTEYGQIHRTPGWLKLVSLALILLFIYLQRHADADLWGHITYGRDAVLNRKIPDSDPYGYTNRNYRWTGHEASSEIVFYFVWSRFGAAGLIVFKMLVGLLIVAVTWNSAVLAAGDETAALSCVLLMTACLSIYLLIRPQIFTYLFLALSVNIAVRYMFSVKKKVIWAFPVIIFFWTGFHGGFVAGLGFWFAFSLLETVHRARGAKRAGVAAASAFGRAAAALRAGVKQSWKLWCAGVLALILTFFNPTAPKIWNCILTALANPYTSRFIGEWSHVFARFPTFADFVFIAYAFMLLRAIMVIRPTRDTVGLGLALLMSAVAASSYRHIPLMAIIVTPVMSRWFALGIKRDAIKEKVRQFLVIAPALALVLGTLLSWMYLRENVAFRLTWYSPMPQSACNFIRAKGLKGNLYCEFAWGQYIIWRLGDICKVGMDGRYDTAYPIETVRKHFDFLFRGDPSAVESPPADMVLVNRKRAVANVLRKKTEWTLVYEDQLALLFIRTKNMPAFLKRNPEVKTIPVRGKNPETGSFP